MPEAGEHVHAATLELRGLRVLILVDDVLVDRLGHEPLRLRIHPGSDERREVEACVAVEHQLVVHDLVREVGWQLALREMQLGNRAGFTGARVERVDLDGRVRRIVAPVMDRHVQSPSAISPASGATTSRIGAGRPLNSVAGSGTVRTPVTCESTSSVRSVARSN